MAEKTITTLLHFIDESKDERIFQIDQNLAKLSTNNIGVFFIHSVIQERLECMSNVQSRAVVTPFYTYTCFVLLSSLFQNM